MIWKPSTFLSTKTETKTKPQNQSQSQANKRPKGEQLSVSVHQKRFKAQFLPMSIYCVSLFTSLHKKAFKNHWLLIKKWLNSGLDNDF